MNNENEGSNFRSLGIEFHKTLALKTYEFLDLCKRWNQWM